MKKESTKDGWTEILLVEQDVEVQIRFSRRTLVISHVLAHAICPVESRETNDGERHANSGCVQKKTLKQYTVREIEEIDGFHGS